MGADNRGEGDEHPAHVVTLPAFWLDRTEVTQAAYHVCVEAHRCAAPNAYVIQKSLEQFRGAKKPVSAISFNDATSYCGWLGKRLPHEAEFEKAIRGTDARRYPWGNAPPTHELTVYETNFTDDVGSHPTGRGPYGHDDLAGNVWEWTADDYDPLAYTRPDAGAGIPGTCTQILKAQNELRVEKKEGFTGSNPIPLECEKSIRGGAYNYDWWGLRASNRVHHPGHFKLIMTGFRCARDAAPAPPTTRD